MPNSAKDTGSGVSTTLVMEIAEVAPNGLQGGTEPAQNSMVSTWNQFSVNVWKLLVSVMVLYQPP